MTTLLARLLGRGRARLAPRRVVVYSRQCCGCCDRAFETLARANRRYPLAIQRVDVDLDPELQARFGQEVPVVEIDGKVRFRGKVNPVLLERLLAAKADA